jgi:hypothetical protein
MGICPRCKAEIDTLMQYAEATVYREAGVGSRGLVTDNWQVDDVNEDGPFCCPECGEEITCDEDEAYDIIKDLDEDD